VSKIWFTSDLHFGHQNLMLKYRNQRFKTIEEMDNWLINSWQSFVKPVDTVYILGDVSFKKPADTAAVLEQLTGHKILIRGNHDKNLDKPALRKYFERIEDILEIKVPDTDAPKRSENDEGKQRIVMCHYPMITWNSSHYGSWMLHGHCHGTLNVGAFPDALRLDVGFDNVGYVPIDYEWVKQYMRQRKFVAVDHHLQKKNEYP